MGAALGWGGGVGRWGQGGFGVGVDLKWGQQWDGGGFGVRMGLVWGRFWDGDQGDVGTGWPGSGRLWDGGSDFGAGSRVALSGFGGGFGTGAALGRGQFWDGGGFGPALALCDFGPGTLWDGGSGSRAVGLQSSLRNVARPGRPHCMPP